MFKGVPWRSMADLAGTGPRKRRPSGNRQNPRPGTRRDANRLNGKPNLAEIGGSGPGDQASAAAASGPYARARRCQ